MTASDRLFEAAEWYCAREPEPTDQRAILVIAHQWRLRPDEALMALKLALLDPAIRAELRAR